MESIINAILKMIFLFIAFILSLYAGVMGFILFISPDADPWMVRTNLNFFLNILLWAKNNWSLISLKGAYVIVAGQPAISFLILKLISPTIISVMLYFIIVRKKWSAIKSVEIFKPKEKVHGNAQWATDSDIERAGLRAKEGMMLGVDDGGYFVAAGYQHALLFAPTGSGKGVGFVLPNLLFWKIHALFMI